MRTITVWLCDECGYWRQDKATGVHMAANPEDWRGKMVEHPLRAAVFVEASDSERSEPGRAGDGQP